MSAKIKSTKTNCNADMDVKHKEKFTTQAMLWTNLFTLYCYEHQNC